MIQRDSKTKRVWDHFEAINYNHASAILKYEFAGESDDLRIALDQAESNWQDTPMYPVGKTCIPQDFSELLRSRGWKERTLDVQIRLNGVGIEQKRPKIWLLKGRVGIQVDEGRNERQTNGLLRDLYTFYDCDVISVGVFITCYDRIDPLRSGKVFDQGVGPPSEQGSPLITGYQADRIGPFPLLIYGVSPSLPR